MDICEPITMNIEINLFASLSRYKPENTGGHSWVEVCRDGTTILDFLHQLNVPEEKVKLIFLNGKHAKRQSVLHDGDRLGVFPPVGGG